MTVKIQSVNFDADQKLVETITKKVEKLQTFHDKIIDIEVYLKVDNIVHQIKDKIVEIKVNVPKHTFFNKQDSKSFEESFDLAYNAMVNQIKKYKEKTSNHSASFVIEDDSDDYFADEIGD